MHSDGLLLALISVEIAKAAVVCSEVKKKVSGEERFSDYFASKWHYGTYLLCIYCIFIGESKLAWQKHAVVFFFCHANVVVAKPRYMRKVK